MPVLCLVIRGDFPLKFSNYSSLLTVLDNHFVISIMTNTAQFRGQGMSLNDLVTEYLELRLSALRKSPRPRPSSFVPRPFVP